MQATLKGIKAFDATIDKAFEFIWSGVPVGGSKLTVKRNDADQALVYQDINYPAPRQYYILPSNSTVINGGSYIASIEVIDTNGNVIEGSASSYVPFVCHETPTIVLKENDIEIVSEHYTIESSSISVQISYSQSDGDGISTYQLVLYDINHNKLFDSGAKISPSHLTEEINTIQIVGLQDSQSYYLRGIATSQSGIISDTGYIKVDVIYSSPSSLIKAEADNQTCNGLVKIIYSMSDIEGIPDTDVVYIDNSKADLRTNKVVFKNGFSISGDYCFAIQISDIVKYGTILSFNNEEYESRLAYREGYYRENRVVRSENDYDEVLKGYFELLVGNAMGNEIFKTEYIDPISSSDQYVVWIKRKNNSFDIQCYLAEEES